MNAVFRQENVDGNDEYRLSDISPSKESAKERALSIDDIVKRSHAVSTVGKVEESCRNFSSLFQEIANLSLEQSATSVAPTLEKMNQFLKGIVSTLDALNDLPSTSKERAIDIGACIFPIVSRLWSKNPPSGAEAQFSNLAKQYLESQDPDRQKELKLKEWLNPVLPLLAVQHSAKDLPNPEYYVRLSMEQSAKVERFDKESLEIENQLTQVKETNQRSMHRSSPGKPLYPEREQKLTDDLRQSRARASELFSSVSDVSPFEATQALGQLQVKVAPLPALTAEVLRMVNSTEKLILACIYSQKKIEGIALTVPEIKGGKLVGRELNIPPAEIKLIGADGKKLANLIHQFIDLRTTFRELVQIADPSPAYAGEIRVKMNESLTLPFSRFSKSASDPFVKVLGMQSPEVKAACCRWLAEPIVVSTGKGSWGYVLEKQENYPILKSVIAEYLLTEHAANAEAAALALRSSPITERGVLGLISRARALIEKGRLGDLGLFFDEAIERESQGADPFSAMGLLLSLYHYSQDEITRIYLRQQIPRIGEIKAISERLTKQNVNLGDSFREVGHSILRALSQSLDDYYMDESGGDLKDLIENYRFFLAHPDILKGITGNEGMRNSIVIYGEPGVGKTHLVNCLKNELNIDLHVLSPAQKKSGQDRLDYTKSVIQNVKDKKRPCILLIDEAESTLLDRMSPAATSEDRECTNYLLQEIDELRRSFPYVFIILATNYIDRVDDAMLRPGRVDLEFEMKLTSPKGRETIIRQCLARERLAMDLSAEEMKRLVDITEGFIPVRLIQVITETNRVYLARSRIENPEIVFTKELLLERFTLESQRLKRQRERIEKKHRAAGEGGDSVH